MDTVIDENVKNINVPVKFKSFEDVDERFMNVEIAILHIGENRNNSYFSKEVVEQAIPTIANTPILGFIERKNGEDDYSDHRQVIVKKDGEYRVEYLANAWGVIPETNNARFEMREDEEGREQEYLVVDGIMWKKWDDSIDIMERDEMKNQSMEITNIEGDFEEDGLFHFTQFDFWGSCILGDDVTPGISGSTIEVMDFSVDNFMEEVDQKMEEYKDTKKKGGRFMNKKKDFALTSGQFKRELMLNISEPKEVIEDFFGDFEIQKYYYVDHDDEKMKVYAESRDDKGRLVGFDFKVNGDMVEIDFDSKSLYKIEFSPMEMSKDDDEDYKDDKKKDKDDDDDMKDKDDDEDMKDDKKKDKDDKDYSEEPVFHTEEYVRDEAKIYQAKIEYYSTKMDDLKSEIEKYQGELGKSSEKVSNLEKEFSELESQLADVTKEKEDLAEFKAEKQAEERKEEINGVIEKFSEALTEEEISEIKQDAYEMEPKDLENNIYSFIGRKLVENGDYKFNANTNKQKENKILINHDDDKQDKTSWQKFMENK